MYACTLFWVIDYFDVRRLCVISRKEVAKLAGVSEATVSRVLNNVGPIKPETKERVLKAAAEIGYVPSALAQQFARRKSGNIGVILPFVPKVRLFSTYYFSEILSGIGEAAQSYGYNLLLIYREPSVERDYSKLFRAQKIDACIMLGSQDVPEEREALAVLHKEGFPFCLVNQRFENESYCTVDADHVEGSRLATEHLIGRGYRRIAFLNGPLQFSNSIDRYKGYLLALEQAKKKPDENLVFWGNYSRKSGYESAQFIAERIKSGQIDAVFTANDRMAIGLLNGLKEHGLIAGKDYGLAGYDDSDGARIVTPPLTTVAVPFYEMGRQAAQLLLQGIESNNEADSKQLTLPIQLIPRETSSFIINRDERMLEQ